jgi:uncharacterized protein (DUF3820 family)
MKNSLNEKEAIVGNICVNKFGSEDHKIMVKDMRIQKKRMENPDKKYRHRDFTYKLCECGKFMLAEKYEVHKKWDPIHLKDVKMPFGKHKGKLICDILERYPSYCTWFLKTVKDKPYLTSVLEKLSS